VDVDVASFEHADVNAELCLHQGQCSLGALPHDVAQLSGQDERALSGRSFVVNRSCA
jgi:hypothetical protein